MSDHPLTQKPQNPAEQNRPHNDARRLQNVAVASGAVHSEDSLNRFVGRSGA